MRSQWLAIGSWQQPTESIIEADPLTTTQEVAQELGINRSMVVWHLKQIGKAKQLSEWVSRELTANQKIVLTCHLLILYATTMTHFSIGLWCVMKSGFYMTTDDEQLSSCLVTQSCLTFCDPIGCNLPGSSVHGILQARIWSRLPFPSPTSLVGGPKRSSKVLPKAKLAPQKGHGHCSVICCWSDPLQLSESWQNHYIWEICLENWWDELKTAMSVASIGQKKGPNSSAWQRLTTCHFKSRTNWATKFCLLCHIHLTSRQSTITSSSTLTTFLQGKCFHNLQEAENAFQEITEHWSMGFYATGINKVISHWQKCVDCNGFYFD